MPLNNAITTGNFSDTELRRRGATGFTVQISNQSVFYQLNVADGGDAWQPAEGRQLIPGHYSFTDVDWEEYGVKVVHGIRFRAVNPDDPPEQRAIINAS